MTKPASIIAASSHDVTPPYLNLCLVFRDLDGHSTYVRVSHSILASEVPKVRPWWSCSEMLDVTAGSALEAESRLCDLSSAPTQGLTCGEGNDILSKLSAALLHQMKHIHESAAPLGALAVVGVFPIDVTSEQVYEHFGGNHLRDIHPTL